MGQNVIDGLNEGVLQVRDAIEISDIQGLSNLFRNVGSAGFRNLAPTTSDPCLQRVLLSLSEVDSLVGFLLQCINDPNEAAELACNTFSYKAQRINSCCASTAYVVLA